MSKVIEKTTVGAPDVNSQEQYPAPIGTSGLIPTPSRLTGEPRALWEAAFEDALRMKCTQATNAKNCAEQEAWRAVKKKYSFTDEETWVQRNTLEQIVAKHYGPGPHSGTGTPQSIHGSGKIAGGMAYTGIDDEIREMERNVKSALDAGNQGGAEKAQGRVKLLLGIKNREEQIDKQRKKKGSLFKVVDSEFNRANYPGIIGQVYKNPPGYAAVEPHDMSMKEIRELLGEMEYQGSFSGERTPTAFQRRKFFSRKKRKKMAGEGNALPWGGFPIEDCGDVKNAVRTIGRAKDRSRTIAHIKNQAKRLGCSHLVPKKWRSEGAKEKSMAAEEESMKMNDEQLALAARSAGINVSALRNRRAVRAREATEDQSLLDAGYADHPARRPNSISSAKWTKLPLEERTVGAVVWKRHVLRTYAEAVENAVLQGWKAEKNPHRSEEWIFKSWIETPDGWQLVRGILVRRYDSDDWYMKEVSRGASSSLAIRIAPDEARR